MIWRIKGYYKDGTYYTEIVETIEDAETTVKSLRQLECIKLVTIEVADKSVWRSVFQFT